MKTMRIKNPMKMMRARLDWKVLQVSMVRDKRMILLMPRLKVKRRKILMILKVEFQ